MYVNGLKVKDKLKKKYYNHKIYIRNPWKKFIKLDPKLYMTKETNMQFI